MLNVVILSVFMPNAVAPLNEPSVAETSGTGDVFEHTFCVQNGSVLLYCIPNKLNFEYQFILYEKIKKELVWSQVL